MENLTKLTQSQEILKMSNILIELMSISENNDNHISYAENLIIEKIESIINEMKKERIVYNSLMGL
jgi:hypothetical protein